jgi:FkbM family methyltransferase
MTLSHHLRATPRIVRRRVTGASLRLKRRAFLRTAPLRPRGDLTWFGTDYGGWPIATTGLSSDSICYLAGVGEDISFDLALIARFGCRVHAFDPVPRVADYVRDATDGIPEFVFHSVGLWSEDRTMAFFAPEKPGWVSHTAVGSLRRTPPVLEAIVRSVPSLMRELGHDHLDLLKLSVEGAEHEVLGSLLAEHVAVRQLCVEFTPPQPLARVRRACEELERHGFALVAAPIRPWNWKCSFVHSSVEEPVAPSDSAWSRPES